MGSNSKSENALKLFCQYFGLPEKLTFGGSKKEAYKGTTFMKEVHRQGIDYHKKILHFTSQPEPSWYYN